MKKELEKIYQPTEVEDRLYKMWMDKGYFHAVPDSQKTPYTIVIPPPNITGQLHMGHALDNTLQDILIRFKRMQGFSALWLPGTDHASIATEAKIVEAMKQEGLTKDMLGREKFLERAWEWKEKYGGRIIEQLKKLGFSCDWERERFTLDEGCSKAVTEVFINLYKKGLIYRGERIINWCPHCLTSISDAEVEHEEKEGHFWHIQYPLSDGSGFLVLATTRPETLLGDTAVAVHPKDERYASLIGKTVILPLVNREIPIVGDEYVEMDFGTGVVKITPAHDPNDFEVGLRHNLPVLNVMTDDGIINENGGSYAGMPRYEARAKIVEDLKAAGLLVKVEDIKHNVGSCYRCTTIVEPRVSEQWFVRMEPLAKPAIEAVKTQQVHFVPERFEKVYFNWMENIKDWCISRQLWWGHRIPAYYCKDCGEMVVAKEIPSACPKCGGVMVQDEDTLDTWFSSALWPFSTLGWPEETEDLNYYYPTNTLITGYDIIFFWVARMIFSGIEHRGKVPFDTVFIHGIVRDPQGRKMSKSLGNGIDPLEVTEQYGADALRFTLASGNSPGNDIRYSEEKVCASRNFANKLWNAARFVLMNLQGDEKPQQLPDTLAVEDKWLLSQYNRLVAEVTANLDKFELGIAVQKLYDFIWDVLCDWYIELVKTRFLQGGEASVSARQTILFVFDGVLKLLHPFMPFITEEIWQSLPHSGESIMVCAFPRFNEALCFEEEEREFGRIVGAIRAVRNCKSEMNVPPSKKTAVYIETEYRTIFESSKNFFVKLAYCSEVYLDAAVPEDCVSIVTDSARLFIPLGELVDREKEVERLSKELALCEKDIAFLSGKLLNKGFVDKAPPAVIEEHQSKLDAAQEKKKKLLESLDKLK